MFERVQSSLHFLPRHPPFIRFISWVAASPHKAPRHPWQYPSAAWDRIHIDYGQWGNKHFLVIVDAFSKWPEVKLVSSTTTQRTIDVRPQANKPKIVIFIPTSVWLLFHLLVVFILYCVCIPVVRIPHKSPSF